MTRLYLTPDEATWIVTAGPLLLVMLVWFAFIGLFGAIHDLRAERADLRPLLPEPTRSRLFLYSLIWWSFTGAYRKVESSRIKTGVYALRTTVVLTVIAWSAFFLLIGNPPG